MKMTDRPARSAVVAVIVAVMALAACSSSSKPSSSSPTVTSGGTNTGTSDTCKAVNDFKTSLNSLKDQVSVTGGKAGAQAALDSAQQDLDQLKSDVKSADKPQVDALQSSLDDLKTAVQNFHGLSDATNVLDALRAVGTDAQSLYSAIAAGCSSS